MSLKSWQLNLLRLNAIVAWAAVGVSFSLMAIGYYIDQVDPSKPTLVGNLPAGKDQVWERFFDWSGYFTILSNIVVAVVLTALVSRPEWFTGDDRRGRVWRALRLDSVVMIVITGAVYQLLLAEGGKTGWDFVSDSLQHAINPLLTVAVWLLAGPRGILQPRTILASLALPVAWAGYALVRGSVVGAYPYDFLDVSTYGLPSVLLFTLQIMAIAVLIAVVLLGVDRLLARAKSVG